MDKINQIIGLIFAVDGAALSNEETPKTLKNWDSVTHILVLTALEDELNIKFSDQEMEGIKSIGDIRYRAAGKLGVASPDSSHA